MIKPVEEVCKELSHFGTINPDGNDIEIWAEPITRRNKNEFHKAGIYCIENFRLNKIYIGMSKDVASRINTHKRELNPHTKTMHHNTEMHNDSMNYGFHNFSFGILETFDNDVEREFLLKREEEWIRYFENQSPNCLYNKNRCMKYEDISDLMCEKFSPEEKIINNVLMNDENRPLMKLNLKQTLSSDNHITPSQKEEFPIDYLISDVLAMKLEAHNIRNDKLFGYADYLEKRLMQFKKGEINFCRELL